LEGTVIHASDKSLICITAPQLFCSIGAACGLRGKIRSCRWRSRPQHHRSSRLCADLPFCGSSEADWILLDG